MKLFVWDFHGVLEQGNERAVIEISNQALEKFGYRERFTENDLHLLYGLKWYGYFEYLLPNESYSRWVELQDACVTWHEGAWEVIRKYIRPSPYSHEVLDKISRTHDQIVISNVQQVDLPMFLESVRIDPYFPPTKAFGTVTRINEPLLKKAVILQEYLKGKSYESIIAIGDSAEDVELSDPYQGVSYLYSHSYKAHKLVSADHKITDLRDVLNQIL